MTNSYLEDMLAMMLDDNKIKYIREYKFKDDRKWRFDFVLPDYKLAIEIQGGIYIMGRHSRGRELENEYEKFCEAVLLGWYIMPFTPRMVTKGIAIAYITNFIKNYKSNERK